MHKPPAVRIVVGPSRLACVAIAIVAASTFAIALTLSLAPIICMACFAASATWAGNRIWVVALRRGPHAVRTIGLQGDHTIDVGYADGSIARGSLRETSFVGPDITTLVWRAQGARYSRSVLILPDMLPAEDFRRLRVLMRYGRNDETDEAPASHA